MTVQQAVFLFVAMGCEPQALPGKIDDGSGEPWRVRFLINPANRRRVSLGGLEPDEMIGPSTIDSWERVLQVKVPPPPPGDWWNKPTISEP